MQIILASSFNNYAKDSNGKKYPIAISDEIHLLTNIKIYTPSFNNVIMVANNPADFETTDYYANLLFQSLKMSGLIFKNEIVFDNRNKDKAKEIFSKAGLIFLSGGSVSIQNDFFKEISIGELLKISDALIVGGSAGAMNLCQIVLCYPDFIKGVGLLNEIIVPHFDGKNKVYERNGKDEYNNLLSLSVGRELIGIDEYSYLLLVDGELKPFGSVYRINNKICRRY